jgi:signal transduction histidine kinase
VLFATDKDGVIRVARGKGAVRLGANAIGRSAFELFADVPRVKDNLLRTLAGEAVTTEGESDHVWWETRYMPLAGPKGEVAGVVGVTMDATARKRAEEDLKKANLRLTELDALKARFVANVSHELRTPLALVLGLTERMRREEGDGGRWTRDLDSVGDSARLLLKHVNDLLDVAKLDAGAAQPDYAHVDLARLVSLAASQFEVVASDRRVAFTVAAPDSLRAAVDPDKVQRVLLNLLSNAFKLTPPHGTIRCSLERLGDSAVLTVADSGPGVPPSRRQAIFERFVQLDRGDEQHFGGTGLGLSIVRDFVELHGGTITVDDAVEGGARFVVSLPIAAPEGAAVRPRAEVHAAVDAARDAVAPLRTSPARASVQPGDGKPVVLVVEDNAQMRRFMSETLGAEYVVVGAEDGARGLELARAHLPAAIITDLMMPRMGGEELLRAVRAQQPLADIPVLVLTAKADDDLRARLLREGAQDYLLKPFAAGELLARVANAVRAKRARDVLAQALESTSRDVGELAEQLVDHQRNLRYALDSMKVARDEAEKASGVKSAFLSMLSHEVTAPLAALEQRTKLLEGRGELSDEGRAVVMAATRLAQVVDTLLGYADLQSGRLSVRPEPVDVAGLVSAVVGGLAARAAAEKKELTHTVEGLLAPVTTDPRLLRLLVANLIDDAIRRSEGAVIDVALESGPDGLELRVTGAGMGAGMGDGPDLTLGLTIVRHVADALGARVDVSGAMVTVTVPRVQ